MAVSMHLTVTEHQTVHLNGRKDKTQWNKQLDLNELTNLLVTIVQDKEIDLRAEFIKQNKDKGKLQMIRTFYITKIFDKKDIKKYCPNDSQNNGVCIEVAISSDPTECVIHADIHGYPANVNTEGVGISIKSLCTNR